MAQARDTTRSVTVSVSNEVDHLPSAAQSLTNDHTIVTPYSAEFDYPKSKPSAAESPRHTPVTLKPQRKETADPPIASLGMTRAETDARHRVKSSKKKRKSKRSKRDEKKWKKKMKEIGKNHPEFELSYDLLLGIRTSTSTVNQSIIRSSMALQEDDSSEDEELSCEPTIFVFLSVHILPYFEFSP